MNLCRNRLLRYLLSVIACFTMFQAFVVRLNAETISLVASDLHNPRGLNFGPGGLLYVAEAGGNGAPSSNCGLMGDNSIKCSALTGSITRINLSNGNVTRFIDGLPSLIAPNGAANAATGVHDVVFDSAGAGFFSVGLGGNPGNRSFYFGSAGQFYGRLARFDAAGNVTFLADAAAYEQANNPDGEVTDSNPYGLLALGDRLLFADAGGNTLNQLVPPGAISTLAIFPRPNVGTGVNSLLPPPPSRFLGRQAVPTSVALGPDRFLYVGQLTGSPFQVGTASVFKVAPEGGYPVAVQFGFTNIIDIAFGPDGSLYVLEIAKNAIPNFAPGRLVKVAPNGVRTEIAAGQLTAPGGIAIGADGALYVTNSSVSPVAGQVLKIVP